METQNQSFLSVGIDVGADFSLMAAALPTQEIVSRNYKILHSSLNSIQGAVDRIRALETKHGLKAKIFMESTSIYHLPLYHRLKDEGFDVFVLNPLITHANSNINVRGVHNDKFDAQKIALLGLKPQLKTSVVPDDDVAAVKALAREYHTMKKECTQYICRLTAQLRQTFPQYLPVFSKVNGKASLEVLSRYTTPEAILTADKTELVDLIQKTAGKGRAMAEQKRETLTRAAKEAAAFGHSNAGNTYLIHHFVDMIRLIDKQTDKLLAQIRNTIKERPDSRFALQVRLLETIPGVGFLSAVTLICEIGNFDVFRRPKQLYSYFGLDPKVRQSGNFKGTELKMSKRGSPLARRCVYIIALQSVSVNKSGKTNNAVLRDFYVEKCKSKEKMTALGAVMHKICNIVFAVLRDEKPFVLTTPEEHRAARNEAAPISA
jgi:transposase